MFFHFPLHFFLLTFSFIFSREPKFSKWKHKKEQNKKLFKLFPSINLKKSWANFGRSDNLILIAKQEFFFFFHSNFLSIFPIFFPSNFFIQILLIFFHPNFLRNRQPQR